MRKTWSRSLPIPASTWKSAPIAPCGNGISKETDPSDAKSSGPIGVPSGLLPKSSLWAVSALTAVRKGTRGTGLPEAPPDRGLPVGGIAIGRRSRPP